MDSGWVPTIVETITVPDDVAAWAAQAPAGGEVVGLLAQLEPERLSYAGRVDALVAVARQLAWLHAREQRLLAALAAAPSPLPELDPGKQWVREELACALRIGGQAAAERLALATDLARLPGTMALLEAGVITAGHARTLAEAVRTLDAQAAARVEARVLDRAPEQSPAAFRAAVTRAVLAVAPARAEQRHQQALTERRVCFSPTSDGMSQLWALLPAPGAAALKTVLDALARKHPTHPAQPTGQHGDAQLHGDAQQHGLPGDAQQHGLPGDDRSADQRRADALIQLALDRLTPTSTSTTASTTASTGGVPCGPLPTGQGLRPGVQVTVALSTLLGLDEQPGELAGYGPVTADTARRLAADPTGTWRRLLTDPHGHLLDYGRRTYRPPRNLANHVITRDGTCRFPGCRRPARICELDHQKPWNNGGTTSPTNITALCARHHHLKHDTGWQVTGSPEHHLHWTSPTGRHYTTTPTHHPTDHTRDPHPSNPAKHTSTATTTRSPCATISSATGDPDPPPF